jgi:NAD(P)-dependent dehydrogenase (short-subunit alcohol dehydrogenase family)
MRVLVTGASGGLGPAVVDRFVDSGATVFGVARSWSANDSSNFTRLTADLTKAEDCRRTAEEAGEVDVLIHVIGGFAPGSEPDAWARMLSLNLTSAVNIVNSVLPGMKQRGRGAIVAIGSRMAVEPAAGFAAYGTSKAALVHYIKTLAIELKDSGITANVVLPSTIDTAVNRKATLGADPSKWVKPESIAKAVYWLASDDARDVSGAALPIYGRS